MIKTVSSKEELQPKWARIFLNCSLVNGSLATTKPSLRRRLFDGFLAEELAREDSTVKVTMQSNGKFVFHWESATDKADFISRWSAYDEL